MVLKERRRFKPIWQEGGYELYLLTWRDSNTYLLCFEGRKLIIDSGPRVERGQLRSLLKRLGVERADGIFLTHTHTDHSANVAWLANSLGCPVFASAQALPKLIQGQCTLKFGATPKARSVVWFVNHLYPAWKRFQPPREVRAARELEVSGWFGEGFRVLETPGHTTECCSLVLGRLAAFVGDTAVKRRRAPGVRQLFYEDLHLLKESWQALYDAGCAHYFSGHGVSLHQEDLAEGIKRLG